MDTFSAIEARRAVKHFDPQHEMTSAQIDQLMATTLLSPTSFNIQHWRFVLLRDGELRRKVRAAAWDQAQVTDASLLVIVCADVKAWSRQPTRYWRNAPQEVQDFLVPAIGRYYEGSPQSQRDEAMRSGGIAAQTLMLAAQAMGYDSCPMVGFDFDAVAQLIDLPADHVIVMFVAIGKATQPARARGGQLPLAEVVFHDRFPG